MDGQLRLEGLESAGQEWQAPRPLPPSTRRRSAPRPAALKRTGAPKQPIFDTPLVFVDIETNGLNHIRGRVIEVAAIRVEPANTAGSDAGAGNHGAPHVTRVFNQLIDPGTELPAFITGLTGIRPEDLRGAQTFRQIAAELHDILDGAVFVAHNVRFDYSYLKQEFKRAGYSFLPRQLCTVKLSRALYPDVRGHSLENLIVRHGFSYARRHRAYDDALVLWQFIQHVEANFSPDVVRAAVRRQLRQPALPKDVPPELVSGLPETPGVYIFEDERGKPLYIGKSINIKKRVLQHFGRDHDDSKEFKLAQTVKHISTRTTGGELEALLLESRLVKEMMPLHNRKLRRTQKLLVAREQVDGNGYLNVTLEEADALEAEGLESVLAVYARRSQARSSLLELQKLYELCPKLLGLEKYKGACFLYQLHRCRGACAGREAAGTYNRRMRLAFERQRIEQWPYGGAVMVQENLGGGIIVDNWCVLAEVSQDEGCDEPRIRRLSRAFDLDTYKILREYLGAKLHKLVIQPLTPAQQEQLGI